MSSSVPTVMVSSTFFDLKELRYQLADFIQNELGYQALISESSTFPVDPDVTAIENCRRRVEEDVDVLVLVIGARFGAVDTVSGKSVTNIEYLAARAKGIPVFSYIERGVHTLFEAWNKASESGRTALGSTVEDARLFEFIKNLRETDGVWTGGFTNSSDIIGALRAQLAYQMGRGLRLQRSLNRSPERELLKTLTGKSFRLVVEKPQAWEYLLFAETLADEVERNSDLRRSYDLGLRTGASEDITEENFASWGSGRLGEIMHLSEAANTLINEMLQQALGPPGIAGSPSDLVFVARQLAKIYIESIQWSLRIRRAHPPADDFRDVLDALAEMSRELVTKIGAWGYDLVQGIEQSLAEVRAAPPSGKKREITFTLTLSAPGGEKFIELMRAAHRRRGIT